MTTRMHEDVAVVARNYVDDALKLQGGRRPSNEAYEQAVARAEAAFRQLATTSRKAARRQVASP